MNDWIYYGVANGTGVAFIVVFLIICVKKFINADYKDKLKPLKFLYVFLIILEVLKIFYHIYHYNGFDRGAFPLAFCSNVMYTYPIICHTKNDSMASRICKAISIIPSVVVGILYLFIFPNHGWGTFSFVMNFHSRLYHFCMLAGALYMIIVKLYDFRFKDFYFSAVAVYSYFTFCTVLSLFIKADIAHFGPNSAQLGFLYKKVGYVVGNVILCVVVFIIAILIFYIINLIKKIIQNKKCKDNSLQYNKI